MCPKVGIYATKIVGVKNDRTARRWNETRKHSKLCFRRAVMTLPRVSVGFEPWVNCGRSVLCCFRDLNLG